MYRRNRRHLLKTGETNLPSAVFDDTEVISDNLSSGDISAPNTTLKTPELVTPSPDTNNETTLNLEDFICE